MSMKSHLFKASDFISHRTHKSNTWWPVAISRKQQSYEEECAVQFMHFAGHEVRACPQVPSLAIGNRSQSAVSTLNITVLHFILQIVRTISPWAWSNILLHGTEHTSFMKQMPCYHSAKWAFGAVRRPTIPEFQTQVMYFKPCHKRVSREINSNGRNELIFDCDVFCGNLDCFMLYC